MFNPNTLQKDKEEKSKKLKAIKCLKDWSLSIIPVELQEGLDVDIREVICGDPSCAPVDTIFTLVWTSGGKGIFAVPSTAAEVSQDELIDTFPVKFKLSHIKRLYSHWAFYFLKGSGNTCEMESWNKSTLATAAIPSI